MRISLIVALADNGVIGRAQQLPWHLPDDLKRFKALTMGKPLLMGRRTFESIGRPLPGRRNLVLSRTAVGGVDLLSPNTTLERITSLAEALQRCAGVDELCVIGGAEVFRALLPRATDLKLTRVHGQIEGDVCFPPFDEREWRETARRLQVADTRHEWPMSFVDLVRR